MNVPFELRWRTVPRDFRPPIELDLHRLAFLAIDQGIVKAYGSPADILGLDNITPVLSDNGSFSQELLWCGFL
jgi:hypothetical protein